MNHRNILSLWPSAAALAAEIGQPYETVKKWRQRGNIPSRHWKGLIRAARGRRLKVSLEQLAG